MHTNKGKGSRGSGHDKQRTKMLKKTNIKTKTNSEYRPPHPPPPPNTRTPIGVSGGGGVRCILTWERGLGGAVMTNNEQKMPKKTNIKLFSNIPINKNGGRV